MDKSGGNPSKSTKKGPTHGQDIRKTSFGQWFSPINMKFFEDQVKTQKLDYYTKKLTTESFLKLLLFAQLQEVESLHALGDCLFDDQQALKFGKSVADNAWGMFTSATKSGDYPRSPHLKRSVRVVSGGSISQIDRSFIQSLNDNSKDMAIVQAIITMGKGLDLKVVAEGIEKREQRHLLMEMGCDFAQGFYISKPLSVNEYEKFLFSAQNI